MLNYRKIPVGRNFRMHLLSSLSWVPDKWMIRLQYYIQKGKRLHLSHPKTFNEKIQAYKLFYHDPLMQKCTDKVKVREYVKEKGLGDLLVPLV